MCFYFFFFFSSRRRHTRWPRDWSSDVCSSDLVDERNISRWAADGAVHGVGGPVGGNGEKLVLESSDALVQVFAKWNERVLLEVPRSKHVFLTVVFCAELLFGHDFNVAPVPDGDRRRLVFVLVFIFGSLRVFCSGIGGVRSVSRLCAVGSRSGGLCGLADFVLPLGEAEENDATFESPFRLVKGNSALAGGKFCIGGGVIAMSGFSGFAEIAPGKRDLGGAVAKIVGFGAKNSQVGTFLAPGKARIHGGGGVENAEGTGVHIEDLDAVAGFVIRVDRHGEES